MSFFSKAFKLGLLVVGVFFFIAALFVFLIAKKQGIHFEPKLATTAFALTAFGLFLVTLSRLIHWKFLAEERLLKLHKAEQDIFVLTD